jgi:putative acetyltransferase
LISTALFSTTKTLSPSPSGEGSFYKIRRARHEDAEGIIDSHSRSIQEICKDDYTPEEIKAWSSRKQKPISWCQSIDRDFIWVVKKNNKVEGFGHLALMSEESAEILGLYLSLEVKGMGAGRVLFQLIKAQAESCGIHQMDLLATLTAKTFYERMGCIEVPGMKSLSIGGVPIPCVPMMYKFS